MKLLFKKAIWPILAMPPIYLAIAWNRLPEKIGMQYDLQGNLLRYGDKTEMLGLTIILSVVNLLTWLLLTNMYRWDPKKHAAENKDRLQRIAFAVLIFMTAIQCLFIYSASAGSFRLSMGLVFSGVGLLFAIMGNYMPNLKPNYFAGLRLPWTLENEENWRQTHQMAGKLWFAGGLVLAVVCLFTPPIVSIIVFFAVILVMVIIPTVFSYRLYKKQKFGQDKR